MPEDRSARFDSSKWKDRGAVKTVFASAAQTPGPLRF